MITRRKSNSVSLIKTAVRGGVESCKIEPFNFDCMKDGSWVAKHVVLIREDGDNSAGNTPAITFDLSEYLEGSPVNKYECLFRCKTRVQGDETWAALLLNSDLGMQAIVCTISNQSTSNISLKNTQFSEQWVLLPISKEVTIQNAPDFTFGVRAFELRAFRPLAS